MCLAIPRDANAGGEEQPPGHRVAVAFHRDKDVFVLNCQECPKLYSRGILRSSPESHSRRWPGESRASFSTSQPEGIVDRVTLGAEVKQSGGSKGFLIPAKTVLRNHQDFSCGFCKAASHYNYKNNTLALPLQSSEPCLKLVKKHAEGKEGTSHIWNSELWGRSVPL